EIEESGEWRPNNLTILDLNMLFKANLIKESEKMVFDTQTRLTSAVAQLRDLVGSEELNAAEASLYESNV
ncbi:15431_t:CDS:2, partial [Acaulospora colombiana]